MNKGPKLLEPCKVHENNYQGQKRKWSSKYTINY